MKSNAEQLATLGPIDFAKDMVDRYITVQLGKPDGEIADFSLHVVWFSYILGGWKAMISSSIPDSMYYEVTHSVVTQDTYLDAYKKFENVVIPGIQ